jgi:uncharacterized membrane protein YozB (DUF420 family)
MHCDRVVTLAGSAAGDGQPWALWVLGGLAVWLAVATLVAVVIGRGIRLADRRAGILGDHQLTTADLPASFRAPAIAVRRRAVPLPPIGITLAAAAVALETSGYLLRLTGSTGSPARLLSMDGPFSVPRLFVAALFAVAALAAVAGAGAFPGRRAWWLAVGLVAGGIAAVKAGSTVHSELLTAVSQAVGAHVALLLSGAAAVAVLSGLWFLSRTERRDRRRVLGALALYAGASVGLSAVSSVATGTWVPAATYLEESGEALAGVTFLVAVLVGVAPRLALPSAWALRRSTDRHALELPARPAGERAARS